MCLTHLPAQPGLMTSTNNATDSQANGSGPQRDADRLAEAAELRRQTSELIERLDRLIDQLQPAETPERQADG
jgi:hypothetical protein